MSRQQKICKYCGAEYLAMTYRSPHCGSIDCKHQHENKKYLSRWFTHVCEECGNEFQNHVEHMTTPPRCKQCGKRPYTYEKVEHRTICRNCGITLNVKLVNNTRSDSEHITYVTCDNCMNILFEESSRRMRLCNPSYNGRILTEEEYDLKKQKEAKDRQYYEEHKEELDQEVRKRCSERMKTNNPMFDSEVVARAKRTTKERIASGRIVYPRGPAHKNWKGNNSSVRDSIRGQLHDWRMANLARANYTCERCGETTKELHIHHVESFFNIVNKCAEKLGFDIKNIKRLTENGQAFTPEYKELEKAVIEYHNSHDVGIVVCIDCHDALDPQFRKPKKLHNN